MKIAKYFTCILSVLLCAVCVMQFTAFAADETTPDKVVDGARLLTAAEKAALRSDIADVIGLYGCDIVIVTVDSLGNKSAEAFADDYFDYNNYGIGSSASGILLLVAMDSRDWAVSTNGTANHVFTDYGTRYIGDQVTEFLSDGDYAGAFQKYVSLCKLFLEEAEKGTPFDRNHTVKEPKTAGDYVKYSAISLGIGLLVACIVTFSMKNKLKTAVPQHAANIYIKEDGVQLANSRDIFLYHTVSRTAKPKDTGGSRSGGGTTTHTSSSGRSHGGSSGKF